jgi:hypothetical protein
VVETGGLEIHRAFSAPLQINTLGYSSVHQLTVIWAVSASLCATRSATNKIVCNSSSFVSLFLSGPPLLAVL